MTYIREAPILDQQLLKDKKPTKRIASSISMTDGSNILLDMFPDIPRLSNMNITTESIEAGLRGMSVERYRAKELVEFYKDRTSEVDKYIQTARSKSLVAGAMLQGRRGTMSVFDRG